MMMIKKLFGILVVLIFAVTLSCNEKDDDSALLSLAGVNASSSGGSDNPSTPGTNPADNGTGGNGSGDTGTGGDTGGTDVPVVVPGLDDVKNLLDTLLQKIISSGFVFSLSPVCLSMGFDFIDNESLTIHKQITCDPSKMVMTITMRNFKVKGFECGLNGVMTATVFPTKTFGSYVIAISTPAGSPIRTTGGAGCASTIELSNLLVSVTLQPFSALYTGIVLINGYQQALSEFTVPSDLLELMKNTLGDVFDWLQGVL